MALAVALGASAVATAAAPPSPLSLAQAISYALEHRPDIQLSVARASASEAEVGVGRVAYLPGLSLFAQENRATGDVVAGSIFDMPGLPTTSGATARPSFNAGVFGSALGASFDWNVDLLQRIAAVDALLAASDRARKGVAAERLRVAYAAGDAYLELAVEGETVRADEVNVERARVFATTVDATVKQQLRPAADASRAAAILSLARIDLARAKEARSIGRARLAEALGAPSARFEIVKGPLLAAPGEAPRFASPSPVNPFLLERSAAVVAARQRRRSVGLEYLPRVDLVAALWARGSGYDSTAVAGGLLPDTPNWGAGVAVSWPAMDLFLVRAKLRVQAAELQGEIERQRQVAVDVAGEIDAANGALDGAQAIAKETPTAVASARVTEAQALARYGAGLVSVVDVAEAERILARAEVEDAIARLNVRRAELLLARAVGDLSPFLAEVGG